MDFPGLRLHPMKGAQKDFWAVDVSGNWRIIFRFHEGEPHDVDLVDYH
jgi:toxin HigB-1